MQDTHETSALIGADKVEGTKVYNADGEQLVSRTKRAWKR
jgi:myo-inositol-hexaphosphate 3-phosphohydrolase